jgi:hypothetical protein
MKPLDLRVAVEGDDLDAREEATAYLAERGLDLTHAEASGIEPIDNRVTAHVAGDDALGRVALRIPYRDIDGKPVEFTRLRFLGEPVGFKKTKHRRRPLRFWQEPGSPVLAYFSPLIGRSWRNIAKDPQVDLFVTEGEAKAGKGCLEGFATVGLIGVDNFHVSGDKDRLVPGLDAIEFKGRSVFVVYDSDAVVKKDVMRAERELREALERRGALVQIIRLPPAPNGGKQGLDDYLVAEGPDEFRKLLARADRLPEALDDGAALLDTEYPPIEFAVEPYLPKTEVVEIHGPHGQFKSTLMLYATLSVATGEPWGGVPAKRGRSVFISLEDRASTLAKRVHVWVAGGAPVHAKMKGERPRDTGKLEQAIRSNFRFLSREKASALVLTRSEFGRSMTNTAVIERYVKLCTGADLVVVETAARLHPGGETNEDLAVLAGALEAIATRTGACVVLVRHVSKQVAAAGQVDSYGGRGGGSLADAARSVLSVAREGERPLDPVKIVHTKSTHAARGADLVWSPEAAHGSVYLRPMTAAERTNAKVADLLDRIRLAGTEGVTLRELRDKLPKKGRNDAVRHLEEALTRLVNEGRITAETPTGKPGRPTAVYRATGTPKAAEPAAAAPSKRRKGVAS